MGRGSNWKTSEERGTEFNKADGKRQKQTSLHLLFLRLSFGRCSEELVDERQHATSSDGRGDQRIQLPVSTNSQLQMPRGNVLHTKVFASVACTHEIMNEQKTETSSGPVVGTERTHQQAPAPLR